MRKISLLLFGAVCLTAMAVTPVDDVKTVMDAGDYAKALTLLEASYGKNKTNALVNYRMGVCYEHMGDNALAKKYYDVAQRRGNKDAMMAMARCYYNDYDFVNAKSMIEKYETATNNKPLTESDSRLRAKIIKAEEMLRHVEKIVVVDSVIVDKKDFFKHYHLSAQAGRLISSDEMPAGLRPADETAAFVPEDGASMMWSQRDADGTLRLTKADKLLDGTWDNPVQLDDMLNDEGDAVYPFVPADGQNLYYASNGLNSIGGYDIFVTRKDSETGNYLMPQNVGMPYNSPYDDYMLAIDDNAGVGWWATDRNHIADKLTIYIFIPNATRVNYNPDSVDVCAMAAIRSIKDTWEAGADYSKLIAGLEKTSESEQGTSVGTFSFPLSKGVVYTSFADVKSAEGKSFLEQYFAETKKYEADLQKLAVLRAKYATATDQERNSVATLIKQLEQSVGKSREMIGYYANKVRKAEGVK